MGSFHGSNGRIFLNPCRERLALGDDADHHGLQLCFLRGMAMLTADQRAELEALGSETVRMKLLQGGPGRGAAMAGFKSGVLGQYLTRGDVEDWLAEKYVEERAKRKATTLWEKIGGWAGIVGVAVGIVSILVAIWLAK
jgi:hypothetical protein